MKKSCVTFTQYATWLLWVRLPLEFAASAWGWILALKRRSRAADRWPVVGRGGVVASVLAAMALLGATRKRGRIKLRGFSG